MKKIEKVFWLMIRSLMRFQYRIYLQAEFNLEGLRQIFIMPKCYYWVLYHISYYGIRKNKCFKFSNWLVHKVPLPLRFDFS